MNYSLRVRFLDELTRGDSQCIRTAKIAPRARLVVPFARSAFAILLMKPIHLVLGIGNVLKADDGIGPYVSTALAKLYRDLEDTPATIRSIDCGVTPENYTGVVREARPALLVLVDAAEMGLPVGEIRIISSERAGSIGMSTHSMPLSLLVSYVHELSDQVVIVGVQPGDMRLGQAMSPRVQRAGDELVRLLLQGRLSELRHLS